MTAVDVSHADGVATVCLNRPDQRNALTTAMLCELRDELRRIADDPMARAVVVAGAGDAFCAGADLAEISADAPAEVGIRRVRLVVEALTQLRSLGQPTIASVHGPAIGAGWGVALMCDCCFVSPDARFALPEVPKGFRLPSVIARRLVEVVGPVRAADLVLGGRSVGAEEAVALGIASRVVADADLATTAHSFAATLAANDPARVSAATAALRSSAAPPAAAEFPWIDEGIG